MHIFGLAGLFIALLLQDIQPTMDRIFSEHVKDKKMTEQLMQQSVINFINQFDPKHCYLLREEVAPYLALTKNELHQAVSDYNQGRYPLFQALSDLFERAILRARAFPKDEQQFIRFIPSFPDTMKELQGKLQEERASQEFENSYLYLDKNGKPLSDQAREELLAERIIKAFSKSLDAHSTVLNSQEAMKLRMRLQKGYDGIGAEVQEDHGRYIISKIIPSSHIAKNKALCVGDELIAIDGNATSALSIDEVVERLQGPAGSQVTVKVKRGQQTIKDIPLTRQKIILTDGRVDTKTVAIPGGIVGVIALHSFYEGPAGISSTSDVKKAIQELSRQKNLKGVILDLRDNRGGYLMQAVGVAGLFIKTGVIVIAQSGDGKEQYFRDTDPVDLYSGPLVVLVSRVTASAAEIVAQALQDYGTAIIVGDDHTYGKGSIQMQTVTTTKEKSEPAVKVTVGRYYGVSGKSTQLVGVRSDIIVPSAICHRQLGEAYLHLPLEKGQDRVAAQYHDDLVDIEPSMKEWYIQYYKPYLEQKDSRYQKILPQLQQRSFERIEHNMEYRRFLEGEDGNDKQIAEFQLQEAINIVADINYLEGG